MAPRFSRPDRPIPIDMRGVRSGYVYVAQSPDRQDLCKIGHTTRPPHIRMRELGKTTWLSPIWVNGARFFWDAMSVERALHQRLSAWACPGAQEWFCVPSSEVAGLLGNWDPCDAPDKPRVDRPERSDPQWLAMRLEWCLDLLSSTVVQNQKDGWRDIERLSALGYSPATWLLVERLMVEDASPDHVLWVLDAAKTQGHRAAELRYDWVASFTRKDPTRRQWKERARAFLDNLHDPLSLSPEDRQTLAHEVDLWAKRPSLAWLPELPAVVCSGEFDGATPTP